MKIIDLLNKIANGEEIPIKFTYKGYLWEYDINNKMWFYYFGESKSHRLDRLFYLSMILNDEVEVCSTGLTVKEAEQNFYKISEALYKEANKKREKKIPEIIHWHEENGVGNDDDAFYVDVNDKSQYVDSEYDSWEMTVILKINEIIDYLKSKGE